LHMVRKEGEYERLADHVSATEEGLRSALFAAHPAAAEAVLAWAGDEAVGFALYYVTFSTFAARCGLWLEDLFVEESWRGRGVGGKLLAHVAGVAVERGYHSLSWNVLKWNEQAIRFYRDTGAAQLDAWDNFQLAGAALHDLAAKGN
jgi:GNAT superfamily N-acetyltransferase